MCSMQYGLRPGLYSWDHSRRTKNNRLEVGNSFGLFLWTIWKKLWTYHRRALLWASIYELHWPQKRLMLPDSVEKVKKLSGTSGRCTYGELPHTVAYVLEFLFGKDSQAHCGHRKGNTQDIAVKSIARLRMPSVVTDVMFSWSDIVHEQYIIVTSLYSWMLVGAGCRVLVIEVNNGDINRYKRKCVRNTGNLNLWKNKGTWLHWKGLHTIIKYMIPLIYKSVCKTVRCDCSDR